jgi:hypothetical protein
MKNLVSASGQLKQILRFAQNDSVETFSNKLLGSGELDISERGT